MKYDLSAYTPLEREMLRRVLVADSITFEMTSEVLVIDTHDEASVDAKLRAVERMGAAIAEEINLEELSMKGIPEGRRCENCGLTPAAPINLRRQVGMVLAHSTHNVSWVLCNECAEILSKEMQKQTAIKGWTSPYSLVMNPFVIAGNVRNRRKHRRELGR